MPESHLWLLNHVGNAFGLSTRQHKFTQLHNTWNEAVTVKRLSSSSWCVWGLGHDHRVYIYVFSSDLPIRVPDTLYENQRYIPFHGFSQSGLLPMDRYAWSDEKGVKYTPKESFRLPSAHWTWDGNWMVDENLRGEVAGVEGWQYAIDFPSSHYTPEKHWKSCVRKRKWIRFRRFTSTDAWVRISDMEIVENSECFIDISVGGFSLPSQLPGFLSVWAVTNSGRVFMRKQVCQDQPEGVSWQEISLGSNLGVINICVGASNLVWAITWDGQALVRTGINRNKIHGTQWEVVECPDESSRLMQIAVGKNVVWALSREGKVWFRKGTCGDDILGNISSVIGSMWVEMVGDMSYIAVSANDQVFAIDANDGGVYFRTGITSSNLTGKTWQKISLHEDMSVIESMMSEACTCPSENVPGSALCEFHKRRTGSFTTSCSSTSTSTWTDEPSSDVFLSPTSPETVLPSTVEDSIGTGSENFTQQHSSNKKDSSNILKTPASPVENQQILNEKEDSISSASSLVNNFDSNVTNDESRKEDTSLKTLSTDGSLPKEQLDQDGHVDPSLCVNAAVEDSLSSDQGERRELQQTSGETKIQSFVEELTEVDRFLVETEILQSSNAPFPSDSLAQPPVVDSSREVSDAVVSSDLNGDNIVQDVLNEHGKTEVKILDDSNSEGKKLDILDDGNHHSLTHSDADSKGPSKSSHHKHKSKHPKRPDHLSLTEESDSIVYRTPKGKKKKKKVDTKKEPRTDSASNESKCEDTSVLSSTETSSHSVQFSEGQVDNSHCDIKGVEEPLPLIVDDMESAKHQVNEPENGLPEQSGSPKECDPIPSGVDDKEFNSSITDSFGQSTESAVHEHSSSSKADSQDADLDANPDIRFQQDSLEVNVDSEAASEPIKSDSPDPFSPDGRRFSLDSPVSDRIFDFVSFIDEDKDDNDKVDSITDTKDVKELVFTKASSVSLESVGKSDFWDEPPTYSQVVGLEQSFSPAEKAQLIPLQPARKVFRYRSTPSPSVPSNQNYMALDPETLTQTRYAWRSLDVSALHVDDPSSVKWLSFKNKDFKEKKNTPKITTSLRNDIMSKLKARNRREIYQFHNFEQAVKNTTWVKKSAMKTLFRRGGGQWLACNVELEQSKSDQLDKCLTITYSSKNHQKMKQVILKEITCVKRSTKTDRIRTTFIIYTSSDAQNPIGLQAASESEATEWMNLLCSVSASQCNLDRPIPVGSLWSCTKSGSILVSPSDPLETKAGHFCWGLHGGHMNSIETGSGGVTWGIGFDRMTYVYNGGFGGAVCTDVPGMSSNLQEMTDSHRVYVYEHQMRFPVVGWCSKGPLGNNFNWTTETGQSLASQEDVKLPSSKWQWVSSWTVDFNTSGGVNHKGWQFSTVVGDYHSSRHVKDMHRRRRWVRTCRLNTQGPWTSTGSLSLHDISIQIDPVTSSNDVIVLWAIGTNGDVLCRCGVTQDNPLGQSWIHIPTDLDKPFVSITIGGGWRVWGIAGDGSTWYRSGVSQYCPAGKCWLQVVEPPSGNGILRQVSAGSTAVWAVDTEDNLWRRKNITKTFPEGTDWDQVASKVKRVNVGPNDQVWIITNDRFDNTYEASGCMYRRVGITADKPGGTKWEKVIGDGWTYVSIRGIKGEDS